MCHSDDSECVDQATNEEDSVQVFVVQVLASVAASTPVRSIHLEGSV